MSQQGMTPERLEKQAWWWRNTEAIRTQLHTVEWPRVEEAARNYELMRRSTRGRRFPKSYIELNSNEKSIVHSLWCNWPENASRIVLESDQFKEHGWTTAYENQRTQWNLNAPDSVLIKDFIWQINSERAMQKIRPPHPLTGKKNRGVSWRHVELLDLQKYGLGDWTNDDSGRSALSQGKKLAARYQKEFRAQLAKDVRAERAGGNAIPGGWPTLCIDLSAGFKRRKAMQEHQWQHLREVMNPLEAAEYCLSKMSKKSGQFFTCSEFFHFKLIHS